MSIQLSKEAEKYVYYKEYDPDIIVMLGDCLEIMPLLEKVDLIVTDPPYGIGDFVKTGDANIYKQRSDKRVGTADWNKTIPSVECFKTIKEISKDQIIWGANYFNCFNPDGGCLVWDKNNESSQRYSNCEIASISTQKRVSIFRFTWNGMLQQHMDDKEFRYHPTQKPTVVMKWAIQQYKYWNTPISIIDPFLGSGTTLVACKELKRNGNGIGIEINERYCHIAKKRLKNTQVPFL